MLRKLRSTLTYPVLHQHWTRLGINLRVWQLTRQVLQHSRPDRSQRPVIFFNASTRLTGISQNAAFSMLAAMSLKLAGLPVIHFACQRGMSRCVLGTDRDHPEVEPPCRACIAQSGWLYANAPTVTFTYQPDPELANAIRAMDVEELSSFVYRELPLGALVLPSLRWIMRRHHLQNDDSTCRLFRQYLLSAESISRKFDTLLDQADPQAVVLFNGMFFPEAVARHLALKRGIRVITHEVGLLPFSAFFTTGEATAYPLSIPDDFELTDQQNARLEAYLEQRFQGKFSMAGVRFWPGMSGLDQEFLERAARFRQVVPIFTNVIFDTSQPHSNVVFPHMFAWLDQVLEIAHQHADTLFVLRAHPDETRPGKESRESVAAWVEQKRVESLSNVIFVPSRQPLSSYELIQRAKFVMIYNSTIGLEASILGAAVLCAGRARFTQIPTVFFPATPEAHRQEAEKFLTADKVTVPPEFQRNARRFLYYQLFCSSLPFGDFLEDDGVWPGFVRLKNFDWRALAPDHFISGRVILEGILHGKEFLLPDSQEQVG